MKNAQTKDMDAALAHGEFIYKGECDVVVSGGCLLTYLEIETLIFLRRYREMKRRYRG